MVLFYLDDRFSAIEKKLNNLSTNNKFIIEQFDITSLKTNKVIREMQKKQIVSLEKFDKFCKKHQLVYWLDSGTLIGAMRHGKFIPWDDDIDVGMMRDDYEKLKSIFIKEKIDGFTKYRLGFEGIDIFPYDFLDTEHESIINLRRYFRTSFLFGFFSLDFKRKFIENTWKKYRVRKSDFIIPGSEYYFYGYYSRVFKKKDILPLIDVVFEGKKYKAPNNFDQYLTLMYGKSWFFMPSHFGKYRI